MQLLDGVYKDKSGLQRGSSNDIQHWLSNNVQHTEK